MSKSNRKDYRPKNKPSKRYAIIDPDWSVYEAGGGYCRGHKTRHADNQSLNQQVRTKEKRKWKEEVQNEIKENN